MLEFKKEGKTILFVSHNPDMSLCDRIIWLEKGKIVREGKGDVLKDYWKKSLEDGTLSKEQVKIIEEWLKELK